MNITMDLTIGDSCIKAACAAHKIANDFECEVTICGHNIDPVPVKTGFNIHDTILKLFGNDKHSAFICAANLVNRFYLDTWKNLP